MEGNILVLIAVSLAIGLIVLGIIAMIGSGIKSLSQGKQDVNRIVIMAFLVWSLFFVPVRRYSSAATQKETPELENTLWRYCNLNYI